MHEIHHDCPATHVSPHYPGALECTMAIDDHLASDKLWPENPEGPKFLPHRFRWHGTEGNGHVVGSLPSCRSEFCRRNVVPFEQGYAKIFKTDEAITVLMAGPDENPEWEAGTPLLDAFLIKMVKVGAIELARAVDPRHNGKLVILPSPGIQRRIAGEI